MAQCSLGCPHGVLLTPLLVSNQAAQTTGPQAAQRACPRGPVREPSGRPCRAAVQPPCCRPASPSPSVLTQPWGPSLPDSYCPGDVKHYHIVTLLLLSVASSRAPRTPAELRAPWLRVADSRHPATRPSGFLSPAFLCRGRWPLAGVDVASVPSFVCPRPLSVVWTADARLSGMGGGIRRDGAVQALRAVPGTDGALEGVTPLLSPQDPESDVRRAVGLGDIRVFLEHWGPCARPGHGKGGGGDSMTSWEWTGCNDGGTSGDITQVAPRAGV